MQSDSRSIPSGCMLKFFIMQPGSLSICKNSNLDSRTMTTISDTNNLATLVNIFYVEPENQQKLVDVLVKATETVMKHLPGFISANIHFLFRRNSRSKLCSMEQ